MLNFISDDSDRMLYLDCDLKSYQKNITTNILAWCRSNNLRAIDLCGGHSPYPGFESADLENASVICNLNEKWPFENNSIGVFRASDALEHLSDPLFTMREAHRCLAPEGWLLIAVPSSDGRGAFQDPTHVSFWNKNSFWYYTKPQFAKTINAPLFKMTYMDASSRRGIPYVETHLIKSSKEFIELTIVQKPQC